MKLHRDSDLAEPDCFENNRFAIAFLDGSMKTRPMHIHNNLEIYFGISGARCFVIDDLIYPVLEHDIFMINQFEAHRVEPLDGVEHKRYIFSIMPSFLKSISSSATDLTECFYNKKAFPTRISLAKSHQKRMSELIDRLLNAQGFGADLIENAILMEVILLIMNISKSTTFEMPVSDNKHISDILHYIDRSIDEDLSLESLSAQFYLSKGYLCRLFKEHTGTTINEYICAKRISRAKQLLTAGHTVQETIFKVGFNDYANFIRRFKREVGVSPKKYAAQNTVFSRN
jgi:AraC-like DNA-binding protein